MTLKRASSVPSSLTLNRPLTFFLHSHAPYIRRRGLSAASSPAVTSGGADASGSPQLYLAWEDRFGSAGNQNISLAGSCWPEPNYHWPTSHVKNDFYYCRNNCMPRILKIAINRLQKHTKWGHFAFSASWKPPLSLVSGFHPLGEDIVT